jgi:hypothetical protein
MKNYFKKYIESYKAYSLRNEFSIEHPDLFIENKQKNKIFIEEFEVDGSLLKKGSTNLKEHNSFFEKFNKKSKTIDLTYQESKDFFI